MRFIGLLVLILVLAGCESMPISLLKPEISETQAKSLQDEGRFREAAVAFNKLAKYDRKQRVRYQLLSAHAWRDEGNFEQVRLALKGVKRKQLSIEDAFVLDLLDAELKLQERDAAGALDLLIANPKTLSPPLAARYFELRAQALEQKQQYGDAARERAQLNTYLGAVEKTANEFDLKALLGKLSDADKQNLLRNTKRDDLLYPYLAKAGMREAGSGSFADAVTQQPKATRSAEFESLRRDEVRKIALLLPASGAFAPAGKAVQDGVLAAYFSDATDRPEVAIYDSGTTPASALAAYQTAVGEGADRIIGPLQRDQVTALFAGTNVLVPTLALNFADLPVLPPQGSLQFALIPEEEAVSAATYMFERGLKRVGVLSSSDDFGKRTAGAFTARFTALGGEIIERGDYPAAGTQYSSALRSAAGVQESINRAQRLREIIGIPISSQPIRRYDIDGLFLAARPPQARLILPMLRQMDASDWPIVATSHVYAATPGSGQDRDLDGVAFCDAPWLLNATDASMPRRADVRQLSSSIGAGGRLFAFGMDAYRITPYLNALESNPGVSVSGATGQLSADQNGSIRRQPVWAKMQGGEARLMD